MDHWLGLDPVANVLFARFTNAVIEPLLGPMATAAIDNPSIKVISL